MRAKHTRPKIQRTRAKKPKKRPTKKVPIEQSWLNVIALPLLSSLFVMIMAYYFVVQPYRAFHKMQEPLEQLLDVTAMSSCMLENTLFYLLHQRLPIMDEDERDEWETFMRENAFPRPLLRCLTDKYDVQISDDMAVHELFSMTQITERNVLSTIHTVDDALKRMGVPLKEMADSFGPMV